MIRNLSNRCAENAKVRSNGVFDVPKAYIRRSQKRWPKQMNVCLTEQHYDQLFALAKKKGCSGADVIRAALIAYFQGA